MQENECSVPLDQWVPVSRKREKDLEASRGKHADASKRICAENSSIRECRFCRHSSLPFSRIASATPRARPLPIKAHCSLGAVSLSRCFSKRQERDHFLATLRSSKEPRRFRALWSPFLGMVGEVELCSTGKGQCHQSVCQHSGRK